ncbi:Eukaryotic translation initiation factor 3 subunit L [Cyanidiococcus yangmingshanensis]|uniref:Eukaryotic translation initiation factor 3 subunit L n=1 Tax=Cyanidiococcus yangmingshanensis TaxID=2690220 RepID=A0A7J7IFZ1_9RHOD|nr:Eukaryotic translation initiation factor 3 subunit L [Cyanidiococcus yangmingshanensis]
MITMVESATNTVDYSVPDQVAQYILNFYGKFIEGDSVAVHGLYESGFTRIAERFYKSSVLPSAPTVRSLLTSSEAVARERHASGEVDAAESAQLRSWTNLDLFVLLYQELGFRHVHTRLHPTPVQRTESWMNYLAIFDHFLHGHLRDVALPPSWLWDLIDEFLYQFEEYHQYRARGHDGRSGDDAVELDTDSAWNVRTTLEVLHALVEKSGVVDWLRGSMSRPRSGEGASPSPADASAIRPPASTANDALTTEPVLPTAEHAFGKTNGIEGTVGNDNDDENALEDDDDDDDENDDESAADIDENSPVDAQTRQLAVHSLVYRYLGYFAMIGLLRLQSATGDFCMALSSLEPPSLFEIESGGGLANTFQQNVRNTLSSVGGSGEMTSVGSGAVPAPDLSLRLHTHVTACHVALYYYIGFSALMLRRYDDAIRSLQPTILHITRTRHIHTRSFQYEHVNKRIDQMLAILALAQCLGQNRLDDSMNNWLREKLGDRITRIRQGDLNAFEELYNHACPKFASPSIATTCREEFLRHVAQSESGLPAQLSSYLRIYRTIDVQKLAQYMELGDDSDQGSEQVLAALLCLKYRALLKQRAIAATASVAPSLMPAVDGEFINTNDMEFLVDDIGMVDVLETRTGKRPEEYFLRNISRLGEQVSLYRRVQRERLVAAAASFAQREQARLQREMQQRRAREEEERFESERIARAQHVAEASAMLAARPRSLTERLSSVDRGL